MTAPRLARDGKKMTIEQTGTVIARKQVSRRKLLDAARKLFTERGYHDTRPQDIARAAGVGHGTFYLHFADKRECFLAFVDEAADELHETVLVHTANATTIADVVRGIIDACQEYNLTNPGVLAAAMLDASVIGGGSDLPALCLVDRWAHDWTSRLQDLMDKGIIANDFDPRVIGHAIVGACCQALNGSFRDGLRNEDVINDIIIFISRALGPPPGGR